MDQFLINLRGKNKSEMTHNRKFKHEKIGTFMSKVDLIESLKWILNLF